MEESNSEIREVGLIHALIPILFFLGLLIYGLFINPIFLGGERLPLEPLVLMALSFNIAYLFYLGYKWDLIIKRISAKVAESVPVILVLISVGVLIGSWIVSGTIPMMIYFGISWVNPQYIYVYSFIICVVFSMVTGTSWGSAGTIGIVMIGIAQVYGADLAIVAGAIVGGSFFGDKLSPLSDTTSIAALATQISIEDHIHSMLYTTIPAAILAIIGYALLSHGVLVQMTDVAHVQDVSMILEDLSQIFHFNIFLLLPLLVIIYGSIRRKPIVITLLSSAWIAMILALFFQRFSVNEIIACLNKGFHVSMASGVAVQSEVLHVLNRGGVYNLIEGVMICLLVFAFIGTLDVINAIGLCIERIMTRVKTVRALVPLTLLTTLLTNLTTTNQYATSFIIGTAFKDKYDTLKVKRKVLSRSIEDAGTMMENLFPWTPSGIFMTAALGVSVLEYAQWQFMSLSNIVIAFIFAFTGVAIFNTDIDSQDK